LQHVRLGLGMSATVIVMIAVNLLLSSDHPHARVLWISNGAAVVVTVIAWRLPWRRLIERGLALPALLGWSLSLIPLIVVLAHLDGGASSPMAHVILLPLVFAAMAYPVRATILVGAAAVTGQLAIAALSEMPAGDAGLQVTVLALVTVMGARIAHTHERTLRESEALAARLGELARVDGLTGCLNHRGFHERLEAAVTGNGPGPVSLLQVDIDHFKAVNDTHGHPCGDEVLEAVGALLRAHARRDDIVARMGGEEFFLLLPATDLPTATRVAERLRVAIATAPLPVSVTVSVGISVLPDLAGSVDELIESADRALYDAKRAGRDRVVVAAPPGVRTGVDDAGRRP
jgi:diguanylate cyclase (GGDEF)-like protein